LGGVEKTVMNALAFSQPDGAFFRRRVANGDDQVKRFGAELIRQFGFARVPNPNFRQRGKPGLS